jgi:hypothetical protein
MIITDPDEKALVKSPYRDEESLSPDQVRHNRNFTPIMNASYHLQSCTEPSPI